MAKTIDAAPLIPTHEIKSCCLIGTLNQFNMLNVAIGLAMKIINIEIYTPLIITDGIFDGNANSPNKKNSKICINHDTPSKN